MDTAKIFESEGIQAVQLPAKFRFDGNEVFIKRYGDAVVLLPKESAWQTLLHALKSFDADFMEDGRCPEKAITREEL